MDERAPLLRPSRNGSGPGLASGPGSVAGLAPVPGDLGDRHAQFCHLIGVQPVNHPPGEEHRPHAHSLYARALKRRRKQSCTYVFTAALINTLLLTQIVLGAALTGLGSSDSPRILITAFGALNTIIAGVIAFLKSRGQPVRSRMFRDDLSRVVDEIENSAVMWYGISADTHGYDSIDTDDEVTVRGEVARLTRLYDKAVKTNTMNDPDTYSAGTADSFSAGLRKSLGAPQPPGPNAAAAPAPMAAHPQMPSISPVAEADPTDTSPASKPPEQPTSPPAVPSPDSAEPASPTDKSNRGDADDPAPESSVSTPAVDEKGKEAASPAESGKASPPAPSPTPASVSAIAAAANDPDASPASAARLPKREDSQKSDKTLIGNNDNDVS